MELYQWYIIISAILIVLEIFASGFVLLPIGLAGLCTALVAFFRPELWLHAVFFICGSGFALIGIRKLREQLNQNSRSQSIGPVGEQGTIVEANESSRSLKVRVFGDVWDVIENSIPAADFQKFTAGTAVRVTSIVGNKITIELI